MPEITIKELKEKLEEFEDDAVVLTFPDGLMIYRKAEDGRNYRCGKIHCCYGTHDVEEFYKEENNKE